MPANTEPIFSRTPSINCGVAVTSGSSNSFNGLATNNVLLYTADATNGSYIKKVRFKALGTNAATVARIYVNSGSTASSTNYSLFGELSLQATTTSLTAAQPDIDYPMELPLPAAYRLYVGIGSSAAAGWMVTPVGGNY